MDKLNWKEIRKNERKKSILKFYPKIPKAELVKMENHIVMKVWLLIFMEKWQKSACPRIWKLNQGIL